MDGLQSPTLPLPAGVSVPGFIAMVKQHVLVLQLTPSGAIYFKDRDSAVAFLRKAGHAGALEGAVVVRDPLGIAGVLPISPAATEDILGRRIR